MIVVIPAQPVTIRWGQPNGQFMAGLCFSGVAMTAKIPVKRAGKESPGPHCEPRESHGPAISAIEKHGCPQGLPDQLGGRRWCIIAAFIGANGEEFDELDVYLSSFVIQRIRAIQRENVCTILLVFHVIDLPKEKELLAVPRDLGIKACYPHGQLLCKLLSLPSWFIHYLRYWISMQLSVSAPGVFGLSPVLGRVSQYRPKLPRSQLGETARLECCSTGIIYPSAFCHQTWHWEEKTLQTQVLIENIYI